MTKYNIDEDSLLTEIKEYELDRGPDLGRFRISVHRVMEGDKSGTYFAVPNLLIGSCDGKYITEGKSEEEALTKCLDQIKVVPSVQIFPKLNEAKEFFTESVSE